MQRKGNWNTVKGNTVRAKSFRKSEEEKKTRRNRRKNERTVWYKQSKVGVFLAPFPALAISAVSNAHLSFL